MITVEELWTSKYAALAETEMAGEAERRAEDFIEVSRTVCGLELRQLTPRDLLLLDYAKSPFVSGGEIDPTQVTKFLWHMLDRQPAGWLSQRRFFRHCAGLPYEASIAAIQAYIARHFADAPGGGGGGGGSAENNRPLGTSFVAPLIVRLATGIPSLTPPAIMDTPLPQLFQYRKILDAEAAARSGQRLREQSPVDRLLCECLAECNRINAEKAPASVSPCLRGESES